MKVWIVGAAFAIALTSKADLPSSTSNADSCDIGVTPAATLLLPYFEVDTGAPVGTGANTLFTITNVSPYPQIAHVTLWTDWAFPLLAFNIFLTGYDVQGISLYDVIVRGLLPPTAPTKTSDFSNPNFVTTGELRTATTCANLAAAIPADVAKSVLAALTTGTGVNAEIASCPAPVGFNHGKLAKGYATVDVVSYCSSQLATDDNGAYFLGHAASILFDNVLLGDYQQINPTPAGAGASGFDAEGGPMVHIRAVPEGGLSGASTGGGAVVPTNLPFTFYDRYTPTFFRAADRRQPLPSMWAARFIQGSTGGLLTDLKIWREGVTAGLPTCSSLGTVQKNSVINITSLVRFDEHENATTTGPSLVPELPTLIFLPAASRTTTSSILIPPLVTVDIAGWIVLNLSSGSQYVTHAGLNCEATLSAQRAGFASSYCTTAAPGLSGSRSTTQNWVIVSMFGAGGAQRLSVDFDAAWLGNGCTPAPNKGAPIAPAGPNRDP